MANIYKNAIVSAFISLCSTRTLEVITVKDILHECGVSRQTFYNYFRDKYEVIDYVNREVASKAAHMLGDGSASVYTSIKNMLDTCINNKEYYSSITRFNGQNCYADCFREYAEQSYANVISRKHGSQSLSPSVLFAIKFNCYGATCTFIDWINDGMKEDSDYVARQISNCMPTELKALLE